MDTKEEINVHIVNFEEGKPVLEGEKTTLLSSQENQPGAVKRRVGTSRRWYWQQGGFGDEGFLSGGLVQRKGVVTLVSKSKEDWGDA